MLYLCLLNRSSSQLLPNRFPKAWKKFCDSLLEAGITVVNCPVDTRNETTKQFVYNDLTVSPTWIWWRYKESILREGNTINSQLFCGTCADKRKTYEVLLASHAITYLGSEYFSLGHNAKYIVKPRRGQRKEGIKITSGNQIMQMSEILNENRIIQEYKETRYDGKINHDIRCIFYGDQLIGSFIRRGKDIFDNRNSEVILLPEECSIRVKKQSQKLLKRTKTPYAIYSIDIGIAIKTQKPFVIECNSAVGIPSILKVDPAGEEMVRYLKSVV